MIRETLRSAILLAQSEIRWKLGKAATHLSKRIRLEHLPTDSTLSTYEALIQSVLTNPNAEVYVYSYGKLLYPTLVASVEERDWLVMMSMTGTMETAFPPDDLALYLSNSSFTDIGLQSEILL